MPKPPQMTEAQLQAAVLDMCKLFGLHAYHPWISVKSAAGWPDLFIVGRGALARELKNDTNKLTPAQFDWGRWLDRAGIDCGVWRPGDLRTGRIRSELEAIR
jgi:hypothetical protein